MGFVPPDSIPVADRPQELTYLSKYVHRDARWRSDLLFEFLNAMKSEHLEQVGKALEIQGFKKMDKPNQIAAACGRILWESSSIFTYPFKSNQNIDYHSIVVWCASEVGVSTHEGNYTSTFDLEREILRRQFVAIWNKSGNKQRREMLRKIDKSGELENRVAVAGMSGTAALFALGTTVYFSGFAFYTTMSVVMATTAGWVGVTLPFAAYMTASSTVAALSGPIGWCIGAVMAAGGFAVWAGQANYRRTLAAVLQLHCMKAGALYGAGIL